MTLDVRHLRSLRSRDLVVRYAERDAVLYALALGMGRDGTGSEAPYLLPSPALRVLPSFAAELTAAAFLDDCGWEAGAVRHAGELIRLHRPLDEAATLLVDGDVTAVTDLGTGAGAAIDVELRARRQRDGEAVYTVIRRYIAAADGGFGGPRPPAGPLLALPARPPDLVEAVTTLRAQGLWYSAGRPVAGPPLSEQPAGQLPALAALGLAGLAVLRVICEYDHTLIRSLGGELAAGCAAGAPLTAELWQEANVVRFRLRASATGATLIDRGTCVLAS